MCCSAAASRGRRRAQIIAVRRTPLPSVTSELAPTRQFFPIRLRLSSVDPMPISEPSSTVQECTMTRWPTVQPAPIVTGWPGSTWITELSWTLEFSPTVIQSWSPRSTQPHQTLAPLSSRTRPISTRPARPNTRPRRKFGRRVFQRIEGMGPRNGFGAIVTAEFCKARLCGLCPHGDCFEGLLPALDSASHHRRGCDRTYFQAARAYPVSSRTFSFSGALRPTARARSRSMARTVDAAWPGRSGFNAAAHPQDQAAGRPPSTRARTLVSHDGDRRSSAA